jgi:hypothetical protein
LREQCLNPFPGFGKWDECGAPVFLVKTIRTFKSDVCRLEKVELYICSDISFIAINTAVVISLLDVLHIIEVMHARFGQVIRMDYTV